MPTSARFQSSPDWFHNAMNRHTVSGLVPHPIFRRNVLMWPFLSLIVPGFSGLAGCLSHHRGAMPGEPKSALYTQIGDTRVRYTDEGQGPVVVLIHGFASSLETWLTVAPVLQKQFRVISLDLKGFGWTDRPEGDYSPEAQARLVWGLLDSLKVRRASLVGHSWGCSVVLAASLAESDRVDRIALYDAWVYEEQLPSFFHFARQEGVGEMLFGMYYKQRPDLKIQLAFYNKEFVTEELIEDVERSLERPGTVAAALAAVRGQRFSEKQHRYRNIDKPALLLWGREDTVSPLRFGERLVSDLPRARLEVFPRCGHFPMLEARGPSTAALLEFLQTDFSKQTNSSSAAAKSSTSTKAQEPNAPQGTSEPVRPGSNKDSAKGESTTEAPGGAP
jgi:pimeloyl-ACP methyl ester carboxylesterase